MATLTKQQLATALNALNYYRSVVGFRIKSGAYVSKEERLIEEIDDAMNALKAKFIDGTVRQ